MSAEKPNAIIGGGSQRIGDAFALGLDRYSTGTGINEKTLWRFYVAKYCGGADPFVTMDADVKVLREMQRWIERAIETVQTDGGRKRQS